MRFSKQHGKRIELDISRGASGGRRGSGGFLSNTKSSLFHVILERSRGIDHVRIEVLRLLVGRRQRELLVRDHWGMRMLLDRIVGETLLSAVECENLVSQVECDPSADMLRKELKKKDTVRMKAFAHETLHVTTMTLVHGTLLSLVNFDHDEGGTEVGDEEDDGVVEEIDDSDSGKEEEPEIEEEVELLVDHVHHDDALNCVVLDVTQATDLEVAHDDPREDSRLLPLISESNIPRSLISPMKIVLSQEMIENDHLSPDVHHIEKFSRQIEKHRILSTSWSGTQFGTVAGISKDRNGVHEIIGEFGELFFTFLSTQSGDLLCFFQEGTGIDGRLFMHHVPEVVGKEEAD